MQEIEEKLETASSVYVNKIESALDGYLIRLDAAYRIQINEVDNAGMAFLQIASLSQEELDNLVLQYAGNHTMEAALKGYAEKNGLECFPFIEKSEKAATAREAAKYALSVIRNGRYNYELDTYASAVGLDLFKNLRVCIE